jgi:hypothetical protein
MLCAIGHGAITDTPLTGSTPDIRFVVDLPARALTNRDYRTRAAFPGINQNVGTNQMLFPIGRSVYNDLQVSCGRMWPAARSAT